MHYYFYPYLSLPRGGSIYWSRSVQLTCNKKETRVRKCFDKIPIKHENGEWRKLYNEELHSLYHSPELIREIKYRRLRWAGHVDRILTGKSFRHGMFTYMVDWFGYGGTIFITECSFTMSYMRVIIPWGSIMISARGTLHSQRQHSVLFYF